MKDRIFTTFMLSLSREGLVRFIMQRRMNGYDEMGTDVDAKCESSGARVLHNFPGDARVFSRWRGPAPVLGSEQSHGNCVSTRNNHG